MSDNTLVKGVGSVFGSCRNGKRRNSDYQKLNAKNKHLSKSCYQDVIKKLKKHPDYRDVTLENQLRREAEELTDVECLMQRCFSTITHDLVYQKLQQREQDQATGVEGECSEATLRRRGAARVEEVAKFQVKLLLRYVNHQTTPPPKLVGKIASALRMEYGPLHASLLINNEILLEWNSSSLVIPRFVDPHEGSASSGPVLVAATVSDHAHIQCQLPEPSLRAHDEIDLIFDAASSKMELLRNLASVVARYNSMYFYDVIFKNCQNFVLDALNAIGCRNKPEFSGTLRDYFSHLKREGQVRVGFESHQELDAYVREKWSTLSQHMMEYLLAQYFLLHMRGEEEGAGAGRGDCWRCGDGDCMMDFLEAKIDERVLIMHRYLQPQDTFTY